MERDEEYLSGLIADGQAFTYRKARKRDPDDPAFEFSTESWTEWLTKAEVAVKELAQPDSEAVHLIGEAKRLEAFGEIADEFYRCRELALSALRVCARELRQPVKQAIAEHPPELQQPGTGFWQHYGKPIAIGAAATVISGLLLTLLL